MSRTLDEGDVLREIERWIGYIDEDMISRIKIGIKKLPSAQPEVIYCRECKYGEQDDNDNWYCHGLGCTIGSENGSGFCADAEMRGNEFIGGEEKVINIDDPIIFENKTDDSSFEISAGIVFRKSGVYEILITGNKTIVRKVSEQKIGAWIPCDERLPEEGQQILATVADNDLVDVFIIRGYYKKMHKSVIAWIPLPEPYKENQDENR